jgi:hypothetical protein
MSSIKMTMIISDFAPGKFAIMWPTGNYGASDLKVFPQQEECFGNDRRQFVFLFIRLAAENNCPVICVAYGSHAEKI